ncbi:carbohydrate ABC transporter permease [Amantichitinum ursilacus]|uniref:sn-glycerol-3-phosphate transport system permease protein UgpE n=1 Tax=Amantichitinum ursilacus TaxID=857265 RepID=A0A0N0XJ27_9NEIS|nr:carbohydrate ABC transporter permease [Amantichitinum ursilacus]KPC53428.1 Inner membrane ABC transporter permease protein YcjP [Amantichitinum ursilacus]
MSQPTLTLDDFPSTAPPAHSAPVEPTAQASRHWPWGRILLLTFASGVMVLFLFPIFWSVLTSFKPAAEASASPPTFWPSHFSWQNYAALTDVGVGIGRYLWNSTCVSLMTVIGVTVLSVLGGYGFSRFRFPYKSVVFMLVLATMMIPFQSILTPLFILLNVLHLHNSLLGLALVYSTFQLPFSIFMMRNSFDCVPRELEEAATLDGCNVVSTLWRVMLPVVTPGIVTVALFAFFTAWNELLVALVLITDADKFTLPVLLQSAQSQFMGGVNWGVMQAGISISILPCAFLFLLLQRFYIHGLIAGAVKA